MNFEQKLKALQEAKRNKELKNKLEFIFNREYWLTEKALNLKIG